MPWSQDRYTAALHFAADAHRGQTVPGSDRPYLVHVVSVAQEVMAALAAGSPADADLAVGCALLHDVIEDTDATHGEVARAFGAGVADGVQALSKDDRLAPERRMADSLERIRRQPRAVWMVKMADRIVNLQPPPRHWSPSRIDAYRDEARQILVALGEGDPILAARLEEKIAAYPPTE